jgi:hypothetical protein
LWRLRSRLLLNNDRPQTQHPSQERTIRIESHVGCVSEMPKVMLHIVCLPCGSLPFILDDDDDKRSESSLLVLAIRKEKKRCRRNKTFVARCWEGTNDQTITSCSLLVPLLQTETQIEGSSVGSAIRRRWPLKDRDWGQLKEEDREDERTEMWMCCRGKNKPNLFVSRAFVVWVGVCVSLEEKRFVGWKVVGAV